MPSGWDGRSKGNRLGYSIFILLIKKTGLRPAYFLLRFVAFYYVLFVPASRKPIWDLYRNKLQYGRWKSIQLLYRNFFIFGQTLIDKIAVMSGSSKHFKVSRTGAHYLNELVDGGKGGILVSAHLGNWELAGHLLQRLNTVVHIVMYDGEQEQLKQYLDQITGPKNFNIIFIREDLSHIYEIAAALNRNELICIHADRFVEGNRTIITNFLNKPARFPLGPFALAAKLKSPVCFVFALKKSKFSYHFLGFPPKIYQGRGLIGAEAMLKDYTLLLEQQTREHPEQWFNYYDFWQSGSPLIK